MRNRSLFASILMACLLAIGLSDAAPVANAASVGEVLKQPGKSAGNNIIDVEYRIRRQRVYPIGPSYLGYDYPYYYSRGYYPTHIGPGFIYLGYPDASASSYAPAHGRRCSYWHHRCVAKWGRSSDDYEGCMNFHRCE